MAITRYDVVAHHRGLVFRVEATESEFSDLLDDYAELVAITWRETQDVIDELTSCLCSRYEVSVSDSNPVESFAAFIAGVKGKNARHIAPTHTRTALVTSRQRPQINTGRGTSAPVFPTKRVRATLSP